MVKLPQIPDRVALTQGARSGLSAAEIANPYFQIAEAFGTAGTRFQHLREIKATQQGADAVYRDENGNLQVDLRSNFSRAGEAYNRAAIQAYTANASAEITAAGKDMFHEAGGDPIKFEGLWKGFSDKFLTSVPREARGPIRTFLQSEGLRFQGGVSEEKRQRDIKRFEGDIKAQISALDDEMSALARSGGTGTSAYQERKSQLESLWNELAVNPEFSVGDKEAAIALDRLESRHLAEGILGEVERTLGTDGIAAARKKVETILTDEELTLTPAERRQYHGIANERINAWKAEKKADLKPIQDRASELEKLLDEGVGLDSDEIDAVARQLAAGGDAAGAMDLIGARATARILKTFSLSDNASQVSAFEQVIGAAESGPPRRRRRGDRVLTGTSIDQAATLLRGFEGFRSSTYWDVNHHRVGYGSDTITRADGSVVKVTKGMTVSREDAERDLRRRIQQSENQARAKVGDAFDALPDNAKAAISSVVYNYGELPDRLVASIKSGNLGDIAAAVRGLADDNGGVNRKRRNREADAIAGVYTIDIDPKIVKEMREEITRDAKSVFEEMQDGFRKNPPDADTLELFARQVTLIDDEDFRTEVTTFFQSEEAAAIIEAMPPEQAEATLSALEADAAAGATIAQKSIIEAIDRSQRARTEALNTDPLGYGIQQRLYPPFAALDFADAGTLSAELSRRQRAVDIMQAHGLAGHISALRPGEKSAVTRLAAEATPEDQAALLGAMAQSLDPETMRATMADLWKGDKTIGALSTAGALYGVNPEAAEGILRGQMLLKENSSLAPKRTDDNRIAIDDILPPAAFPPNLEGGRQQFLDAARYRYADLSNVAGDTSGELDTERMEQAIGEVTGGVLEFNGHEIIAPRYGMSQDELDDLMEGLRDEDIAGAVNGFGEPIKADEVRDLGRLEAIGDGEYILAFGPSEASTYAQRGAGAGRGGPDIGVYVFRPLSRPPLSPASDQRRRQVSGFEVTAP